MFTLIIKKAFPLQQNLTSCFVKSIKQTRLPSSTGSIQGCRTIYTEYSLGVEGFLTQGARLRDDIGNWKENFIKKMQDLARTSNKDQTIYTEDLKKMMAVCQQEKEHLNDVISLTKKYHKQLKEMNLQPFRFGPSLMRLIYIHKLTDKASEILFDEDLVDYVNEDASYQIAMNLLYNNGSYEDVLKLMKSMTSFPKSCLTLAIGANYKISTDESLNDALDLYQRMSENRQRPTFRIIGFISALALNRGKPEVALEVCGNAPSLKHYLVSNLRILAKARLGELVEVVHFLEKNALIDLSKVSNFTARPIFASDVIEEIEKTVNDTQDFELISKLGHLKQTLEDMHLISSKVLEESICAPFLDYVSEEKSQYRQTHSFKNRNQFKKENFKRRSSKECDEGERDDSLSL